MEPSLVPNVLDFRKIKFEKNLEIQFSIKIRKKMSIIVQDFEIFTEPSLKVIYDG